MGRDCRVLRRMQRGLKQGYDRWWGGWAQGGGGGEGTEGEGPRKLSFPGWWAWGGGVLICE